MTCCSACDMEKGEDHFEEGSTQCWACRTLAPPERCQDCFHQSGFCTCTTAGVDIDTEWLAQAREAAKQMDLIDPSKVPSVTPMQSGAPAAVLPPPGMVTVIFPNGEAYWYSPECDGCDVCDHVESLMYGLD